MTNWTQINSDNTTFDIDTKSERKLILIRKIEQIINEFDLNAIDILFIFLLDTKEESQSFINLITNKSINELNLVGLLKALNLLENFKYELLGQTNNAYYYEQLTNTLKSDSILGKIIEQ